jgi:hypothetical protein
MPTIIISKPDDQQPEALARVQALAKTLATVGCQVLVTTDLYHIPDASPVWDRLAGLGGAIVLAWQHPRATEWLLRARGLNCDGWQVFNLAAATDEELIATLTGSGQGECEEIAGTPAERWYPVVDLSRCTNCQHCLQFCLFGVYELDGDGHVRVTNPDNCKAGCPACSRICPAGAIMFPLYEDPAIAGAPDEFVERDAEARRMFYARTEQPCPLCVAKTDSEIATITDDGCCPECGRELDAVAPEPSATLDEIDALIGRLDDLRGGR